MEELLYYVVGFSLTVIGMIASVAYWLGRKLAMIERKFDALRAEFEDMRRDFARAFEGLKSTVSSSHALTLDFLALKGLLDEEEAGFVKAEMERARYGVIGLYAIAKAKCAHPCCAKLSRG